MSDWAKPYCSGGAYACVPKKRVSVSLRRVPWLDGMTAILGSRGFRIEVRDNIYRVVEDKQVIPVTTRTFALNHASAKELA